MATGAGLLQNLLTRAGGDMQNIGSDAGNFMDTLRQTGGTDFDALTKMLSQPKTRTKPTQQMPQRQKLSTLNENDALTQSAPGQFLQGALGMQSHNVAGQPVTNPLNLTADQAYSPYGAGALVSLLGGEAVKGAEAVPQLAEKGIQTTQDAFNTAKAQPGGLEAGFLGLGKKAENTGSPVRISLKPSVYGAGREADVQKTVDTIVPGNTATEKYNNLESTMSNLGDQITKTMADNPKTTSLDQIMQDYDKNLQNEGVYRTSQSTRKDIQQAAQKYVSDLTNEASGGNASLNPKEVSDQSLMKIKQQVNQDAQSIFKKIDNGTSLSDKDKVILAARQTLDDTITDLHPEVKELTTQQSHLYDAADSIAKARDAEIKAASTQPGFMGKLANATIKNPFFDVLLGATGAHAAGGVLSNAAGLGEVGASNLFDFLKSKVNGQSNPESNPDNGSQPNSSSINEQGQIHNGGSISNQINNVNNRYSLTDPIQTGVLMNTSDYAKQISALQQKMGQEKLGNPQAYNTDSGQLQALQAKYQSQQPLRDAWIGTATQPGVSQILTVGNTAYKSIKDADPSFLNAIPNGYDALSKASNGKYAQMSKYLQYLSSATGTDFTQYKTKDALMSALDTAMSTVKSQWIQQVQGYSGTPANANGIPQGPAGKSGGQQLQQALGMPKMPPSNFDFGGQIQ